MTDPYGISEAPTAPAASPTPHGKGVRPVLWVLLAISTAGNVVLSSTGASVIGNAVCGVVGLASATGLIVAYYRNRRR